MPDTRYNIKLSEDQLLMIDQALSSYKFDSNLLRFFKRKPQDCTLLQRILIEQKCDNRNII